MPELLENKDYDGLSKVAHKAKSSVSVMGMTQAADLLKELEILTNDRKEVNRYELLVTQFLQLSEQAVTELDESY